MKRNPSRINSTTVLMNDGAATRTGEDFYAGVPVLGLKENALKIQAATASPQKATAQNRSVLVPAVPEAFTYDLDGNLLQDGLWKDEWDGDGEPKARPQGCRVRAPLGRTRQQNRLTAQELRSDVATSMWKRLEYSYDQQSRRIRKLVKTKTSPAGSWTTASDTRFLYDGWNLIAEYAFNTSTSTFSLNSSHAWGLDLSGSQQGAGGVGGLLWTTVASTAKTYAAAADANGNIVAYVDCSDGSIAGKRDYGAFGEAVLTTGVAGSLPFGFSSKYEERETGLYYYGYRYYSPNIGRWPNRDLIAESGGLNLYAAMDTDSTDKFDSLGLKIAIREAINYSSSWKPGMGPGGRGFVNGRFSASVRCTNSKLVIVGALSMEMNVLGEGDVMYMPPHWPRYDLERGSPRTDSQERQATIKHEMDHLDTLRAFAIRVRILNSMEGECCTEKRAEKLEQRIDKIFSEAKSHSDTFDTRAWWAGGMYPTHPFRPSVEITD